MEENKDTFQTIDEYILQFNPEVQELLQSVRKVIKETAPEAGEKISWRMPTFTLYGNLVHFAAFKNHIGLYPGAEGVEAFLEELKDYKTSKGAIQFPLNKPIPYDLIIRIVKYRVAENLKLAEEKKQSR